MREALWLVKNGIPFDLAFRLPNPTRQAFAVVLSEMEGGGEYDWDSDRWINRS